MDRCLYDTQLQLLSHVIPEELTPEMSRYIDASTTKLDCMSSDISNSDRGAESRAMAAGVLVGMCQALQR